MLNDVNEFKERTSESPELYSKLVNLEYILFSRLK
jgi:hypothetical protein